MKTALVTGASKGLGAELASLLARDGYRVIVTARGEQALNAVAEPLGAVAIAGDVSEADHRRRLIDAAGDRLHLLVNNASDLGPSPMPALADYPIERLEAVLRTNVVAPIALVQEALPLLRRSGGVVVNVTSDAAVGAYEGWGGYGASKAAIELASATLARELKSDGVAVVAVDPGNMRTEMHQAAFPGEDISDRPTPDVTIPFWVWLLGQDPASISGSRFEAQGETWTVR